MDKNAPPGLHYFHEKGKSEVILVPNSNVFDLFRIYFHEAGHEIGNRISFKDGALLTPDQVLRTEVNLSLDEILTILNLFVLGKLNIPLKMEGKIKKIADKILLRYTKGKWNPRNVELTHMSSKQMRRYILEETGGKISTATVNPDLSVDYHSTRAGRTAELPSISTEMDCLQILENSTGVELIHIPNNAVKSHIRARKLIEYIHKRGWQVPSMVDVRGRGE